MFTALSFKTHHRRDFSILLGNAFDHFDISLYSFLGPVMAPIFFPGHDPVVQLILTYGILITSIITQPLGAYIFGRLAGRIGPNKALIYSLSGVALGTVLMGLIPGFDRWGILAPLSLLIVRSIRGIFAAGETTVAKLYILDGKTERQALKTSYIYQSSTMFGIVLASALSALVIKYNPSAWRWCFIAGGITGLFAYFLRYSAQHNSLERTSQPNSTFQNFQTNSFRLLWTHKSRILRAALTDIFGHLTYVVPFIFMNSFVPLVTSYSLEYMMEINTYLLFLDAALIPILGPIIARFSPRRVLLFSSLILTFTLIPLFHFLPGSSLEYILFVRLWVLFWGIVFLCPLNVWYTNLFPNKDKYYLVGMGNALGAGTLGRTLVPIFYGLWHLTNHTTTPALYMTLLTATTFLGIYIKPNK